MVDFLRHHESHPPLFYVLMRGWLGIFGDSEPVALALPILFGTLLIPVAYHVCGQVFAGHSGAIVVLLIAASPQLAEYSAFARPYSLLPLLGLLSVYLTWRGLLGAGMGAWAAQAIVNLAMLMTHNWAWMLFGAEGVVFGICLLSGRLTRAIARRWFLAQLAVVAGYAPWMPILLDQVKGAGYGPSSVNLPEAASLFIVNTTSLPLPFAFALGVALAVALIRALRNRTAHHEPATFCTALGVGLLLFLGIPSIAYTAAVILSYRSDLYHRIPCLLMLTPCVMGAIAFGISSLSSWPRLIGGLLASIYLLQSLFTLTLLKTNTPELARALEARARPSDIVVVTPCWFSSSFQYYSHLSNPIIVYPYVFAGGPIYYDRMKARLEDPEQMSRFRGEIEEAHRTGWRVWLVKLDKDLGFPGLPPRSDEVPRQYQDLVFPDLGYIRANQITRILESTYGKPVEEVCPRCGSNGIEIMRASLYDKEETRVARDVKVPTTRYKARGVALASGDDSRVIEHSVGFPKAAR
jgi:hypothetical protein